MGSSGQSTAAHLHIDCVEGHQVVPYKLRDSTSGTIKPSKKQLDFFIDKELFGVDVIITTGYNDPDYRELFGKEHPAMVRYYIKVTDTGTFSGQFNLRSNKRIQGVSGWYSSGRYASIAIAIPFTTDMSANTNIIPAFHINGSNDYAKIILDVLYYN
jgi:hypothetical protein